MTSSGLAQGSLHADLGYPSNSVPPIILMAAIYQRRQYRMFAFVQVAVGDYGVELD